MSKIVRLIRRCGEYRIRTDGLLHAMQALYPAELIPRACGEAGCDRQKKGEQEGGG